jgi:hypothetical protein
MQTEATPTATLLAKPISRKQRQRALAAARQARHRDRRKRGIAAVIRVEVFEREIDALIRRGLIDAERRADRGEIRAALYKLFDSTINRW